MKTSKKELDVDFIGGGKPLTKDEEQAISEFIKARKTKPDKTKTRKARVRVKKQVI
jgi:hypothetical protein